MRMLAAANQEDPLVVIKGRTRSTQMPDLGIGLQYIPAATFLHDYENMGVPDGVVAMANDTPGQAIAATREDVINGIKSYCRSGYPAAGTGGCDQHGLSGAE